MNDPMDGLHRVSCKIHSARRFKERFGVELTPQIRWRIQKNIANRVDAMFVETHGRYTLWRVWLKEVTEPLIVVFHAPSFSLVSFLTESQLYGVTT